MDKTLKIIVMGLGNPKKEYSNTPHNIGYLVFDYIFKKITKKDFDKLAIYDKASNSYYYKTQFFKKEILFFKSNEFMNNIGSSFEKFLISNSELLKGFKNVIIFHDDIDLSFGILKIYKGKNPAGHKGVSSILKNIKNCKFYRFRIGVWNLNIKKTKKITPKYILKDFKKEEIVVIQKKLLPSVLKIFKEFLKNNLKISQKKFKIL